MDSRPNDEDLPVWLRVDPSGDERETRKDNGQIGAPMENNPAIPQLIGSRRLLTTHQSWHTFLTATLSKCRSESQKPRQRKPLLPCKTRCPTSGRQAASTAKSASHHTRCGPASRSGRDLPLIPAACPCLGRPGWCAGRLTAARRGGTSTSTPRRGGRPPPGPRP